LTTGINNLKKLITIISVAILISGCAEYAKWSSNNNSTEMEEQRIRWKIEKQLDEDRLKDECYKCDCCKGRYKYYNRSYILKKK